MHETFDHTADLGLRIRAATLDELFVEAAAALFEVIVADLHSVAPTQQIEVTLPADAVDYLLFDWLNALLYHFDADLLLLSRFEVHVDADGVKAKAWGEPLDRSRHELCHEVKALTYHRLRVEQTPDGWLAELIIDI